VILILLFGLGGLNRCAHFLKSLLINNYFSNFSDNRNVIYIMDKIQ
jgi:hypothetical protein